MRNNSQEETLKRNYIQNYRFLINEYERVKNSKSLLLFCARRRRPRNCLLKIKDLQQKYLQFGSCGAIFEVCLSERIKTVVGRLAFK